MSGFKVGDRVEVMAGPLMGKTGMVTWSREIGCAVGLTDGLQHFPHSCLRLIPALAPGMRVKTTQDSRPSFYRGKEGKVHGRWPNDDKGEESWEIRLEGVWATERYEADELEVLPAADPQPGEVWRHNRTRDRYVVIRVGKQKEGADWHTAVIYRPPMETPLYSRRLESFLESFTRA
jgi:hypothetical protein